MADVFVSYVSEDRSIAQKIASGLEDAGFSVWWDRHIHGGVAFRKEIDRQLSAAKVVVVLWSTTSLESEWVCDEAQQARDDNKLIPVRLDSVQPPLGFRQAQSIAFAGWNGDPTAPAFASLLESTRHLTGGLAHIASAAPAAHGEAVIARPAPRISSKVRLATIAALLVVAAVVAGVVVLRDHATSSGASELVNGRVELGEFNVLRTDEETAHFAAGARDAMARVFANNGIKTVDAARPAAASGSGAAVAPELALRGSIDRDDDKYTLSADLVRTSEGLVLWSTAMQGAAGEVDSVQERFAARITRVLQCALNIRTLTRNDPSADLLEKFLQVCATVMGEGGNFASLDAMTSQMVEAAPQYAISHAWRAAATSLLAQTPTVQGLALNSPEEATRLHKLAVDSGNAARRLAPDNKQIEAIVDWTLSLRPDGQEAFEYTERERWLLRALNADEQFGPARYMYAMLLSQVGRIYESHAEFARAAATSPLDPAPAMEHAYLTGVIGNVPEAQGQFAAIAHIRPGDVDLNNKRFWFEYWFGDPPAARAFVQSGHVGELVLRGYKDGVARSRCVDALLNARIKHAPLSQAQFDAVCTAATPDGPPAVFEAELGNIDAAYRELNDWYYFYGRDWFRAQDLYLPAMRAVRADARFMPFAARIGLVDYWLDTGHWPDFCSREQLHYDCKQAALAARVARKTERL